jgi:hypothetical protein
MYTTHNMHSFIKYLILKEKQNTSLISIILFSDFFVMIFYIFPIITKKSENNIIEIKLVFCFSFRIKYLIKECMLCVVYMI